MVCVNSVSVSPGSLCLEVGQYGYPSASVSPSNASCKDVRWSSSNSSVASVNQTSGYVYARAEGTAIITATATDGSGKSDSLTVTVSEPEPDVVCVSSVQVSPEILTLVVGSSASVSASVYPPFATDTSVTWSSENSSVARVDSSGRITAVGQGQTKIYATADDGSGKRDYVCVKVTYCGGDNYRDVTQHTMVLQGNYYVCTTCGYRVKTPEFQDVEILATEDYLKVVALEHFISQLLILISKNFSVSNLAFYLSQIVNCNKSIDAIRNKPEYNTLYDYKGPDNKYYCINEIEDSYANFVNTSTITHATLGLYNGLYASICEFVIGVCCPEFAVMIDLIKLITFQIDPMEYGTFILSCLKLDDEYKIISELAGIALTAASDALGLQLVKFVSVIKLYLLVLTRMFMQNIFSVQIIELKK